MKRPIYTRWKEGRHLTFKDQTLKYANLIGSVTALYQQFIPCHAKLFLLIYVAYAATMRIAHRKMTKGKLIALGQFQSAAFVSEVVSGS